MTPRTRRLLLGLGAVAVVASLAVLAWWYGRQAWWVWTSQQELSAEEQAVISDCGEARWALLLKLLEQDLEVDCGPTWFAQQAGVVVRKRHRQRYRWLRETMAQPARSDRTRVRIGLSLLAMERPPPADLMVMVDRAGLNRERLAGEVRARGWEIGWMDPDLRDDVRRIDAALDDPDAIAALVRRLRRASVAPEGTDARPQALAEQALSLIGLPGNAWEEQLDRRARGVTFRGVPPRVARTLAQHGETCRGVATAASAPCLRLLASLVESESTRSDDAGQEAALQAPSTPLLRTYLEARGGSLAADVALRREDLVAWAQWVGAAPVEGRGKRLWAAVLGGAPSQAEVARGLSDPQHVVRVHGGSPWTVAATASTLGALADVPVRVGRSSRGVWIAIGDRETVLDACGRAVEGDPEEGTPEPWPARAVWAQAAVEATSSALVRGRPAEARRLAGLAERLDPVGARGFVAVADAAMPPLPQRGVADALVSVAAPRLSPLLTQASASREEQASNLTGLWRPQGGCASADGP